MIVAEKEKSFKSGCWIVFDGPGRRWLGPGGQDRLRATRTAGYNHTPGLNTRKIGRMIGPQLSAALPGFPFRTARTACRNGPRAL